VARTNDPLPAAPPAPVPQINWTALPDARGIARAHLTFPSVPLAAGYIVYEASESAIRSACNLGPVPRTGVNALPDKRVTVLKQNAGSTQAIDSFSRFGARNLPVPEVEGELPSSVEGIYAYTFSSVTSENVESPRSTPTFV